jgi:hypothetical protein
VTRDDQLVSFTNVIELAGTRLVVAPDKRAPGLDIALRMVVKLSNWPVTDDRYLLVHSSEVTTVP